MKRTFDASNDNGGAHPFNVNDEHHRPGTKKENGPENQAQSKQEVSFESNTRASSESSAAGKTDARKSQLKNEPRSDLDEIYVELCRVDDETHGSFCTGRGPIEKCYLPSDGSLTIQGIVGPIPLPITESYVEKIKAIAEQAPHGRGTETVVDTSIRNALQVDASKVSFGDNWTPDDLIYDYLSTELGLDRSLVEVKPYKLLLYEPGGFFAKHRDTEKEDGMFGTLVIQLPSVFKGGNFVVTHAGETKTFVQDDKEGYHYVAFYADCEHEIQPIESGYRLALVYSLCWQGACTPPTVDAARYHALASTIRRYPARNIKILCHPLGHQYTLASLSSLGAGALKGNDRNKFQVVEAACALNNMHGVIAQLQREDYENGDVVNGTFWSDGKETDSPYVKQAYRSNGSSLQDKERKRLDKLLKYFNYNSVETSYGDLLASPDEAKAFWGDGESFLEVTGNEGATRETFYNAYALLMFHPESS